MDAVRNSLAADSQTVSGLAGQGMPVLLSQPTDGLRESESGNVR